MKQSVTVRLAGHRLNLLTEDDEAYVQTLADHLNSRIEEIRGAAGAASAHQVALLAGLRVVDELFKAKSSLTSLEDNVRGRVVNLLSLANEPESI